MITEKMMSEFSESISDMLEAARKVKGESFVNVATAIFECMQVADAVVTLCARITGDDRSADTSVGAIVQVARSAAARMATTLPDADATEAIRLATRMMERRSLAQRHVNAAGSRGEG